jgi:hypothetical protein
MLAVFPDRFFCEGDHIGSFIAGARAQGEAEPVLEGENLDKDYEPKAEADVYRYPRWCVDFGDRTAAASVLRRNTQRPCDYAATSSCATSAILTIWSVTK